MRTSTVELLGVGWLLSSLVAAAASGQDTVRLNPFLGPDYTFWLAGAVGEMATDTERQEYLLLESDEQAQRFIDSFWEKPERARVRRTYDLRFEEAERRFAEGVYAGGRTDRGVVFVLYGEPEKIEFEQFRDVGEPDVEVWRYPKKAERGLDGKKPNKTFRFVKVGDLTRRFTPGSEFDPAVQRRRQPLSLRDQGRPYE